MDKRLCSVEGCARQYWANGLCQSCNHRKYRKENPEKVKEIVRKWQKKNPEKVKEYNKKWQKKNPEKVKEIVRKWQKKNPEKVKERQRKYREENPEKVKERHRKYREENPEKVKELVRKWREENPDKVKAQRVNGSYVRRVRELNTGAPLKTKLTAGGLDLLIQRQDFRCASCNKDITQDNHLDHMIPLSRGGTNSMDNVQYLCSVCNLTKGKKTPLEWVLYKKKKKEAA